MQLTNDQLVSVLEEEYSNIAGDVPNIDARNDNIYSVVGGECEVCGATRSELIALFSDINAGFKVCRACLIKAVLLA